MTEIYIMYMCIYAELLIVLELEQCGAGEGWSSVGPIVWKMQKYYTESRREGISYTQ
jgi:hypothetical protein